MKLFKEIALFVECVLGRGKKSGSLEHTQTINETEGAFNWKLQVNKELQLSFSKWVGICNCNTAVTMLRINGSGKISGCIFSIQC